MQTRVTSAQIDIAMVGTFAAWRLGTLQARALPFARELGKRGVRCAIVTVPWDMQAEAGVRDVIDGVSIYNTTASGVATFPLAVDQQIRMIDRLKPRIVHVFKPKGYGGLTGWFRRRQLPLVVDSDDWEGDGGWNQAGDYSALQRRLFDWQERRLLRDAEAVTAASLLLARRAASLRAAAAGVSWVPNGLDPVWANRLVAGSRTISNDHADQTNIVLYSRFAEFPTDWLRRYASELSSRLESDESARLVVIGSDRLTGDSTPNVTLEQMGYVAQSVLPRVLGRADIAIYPYHDSLLSRSKNSVKLLELMAAGCGIVAAGIGDVPAVGGDTVMLMPSSEPRAFAAATVELLRHPRMRQLKAAAAQRRALELFTISAVTQRLAGSYRQLGLTLE